MSSIAQAERPFNPLRYMSAAALLATLGTVAVGAAASRMSFAALTDLAHRAGTLGGADPRLFPAVVDGMILTAAVATVALRNKPGHALAWTLFVLSDGVSVAANLVHSQLPVGAPDPRWVTAAVALVPSLGILAMAKLVVRLFAVSPNAARAKTTAPRTNRRQAAVQDSAPKPSSKPQTPAAPPSRSSLPVGPEDEAVDLDAERRRVREAAYALWQSGDYSSKRDFGRQVGLSDRTARRYLNEFTTAAAEAS